MEHCPGEPEYGEDEAQGVKMCMNCLFPHKPENYETIIKILEHNAAGKTKNSAKKGEN